MGKRVIILQSRSFIASFMMPDKKITFERQYLCLVMPTVCLTLMSDIALISRWHHTCTNSSTKTTFSSITGYDIVVSICNYSNITSIERSYCNTSLLRRRLMQSRQLELVTLGLLSDLAKIQRLHFETKKRWQGDFAQKMISRISKKVRQIFWMVLLPHKNQFQWRNVLWSILAMKLIVQYLLSSKSVLSTVGERVYAKGGFYDRSKQTRDQHKRYCEIAVWRDCNLFIYYRVAQFWEI